AIASMKARTFWKTVTVDEGNLLDRLLSLFGQEHVRYCIIGGQAVNAYVEPVVSLDVDVVVAADQVASIESALRRQFTVERFPHSINVSAPDSDVRVQIQLDARYAAFVERASVHEVLGVNVRVARLEDVLQGKIWAADDAESSGSKRQKDLADI